jgi:hypothetical protein
VITVADGPVRNFFVWIFTPAATPTPTPSPVPTPGGDPCAPYLRQARDNDLDGVWSGVGWLGGDETIVVRDREVTDTRGNSGKWLRRGAYFYWTDSDGYKFKARIFGNTVCGTRVNDNGAARGMFVLHREQPTPAASPPADNPPAEVNAQ